MAIAKIEKNRLAEEGIEYREKRIPGKNRYIDTINPYDENNEDTKHHDDQTHPWGKGTGKSMGYAVRNLNAPKTDINRTNIDTKHGGGSYDIYGAKGVDKAFQGDAGRKFLERINEFNSEKEYGKDSVDIAKIHGQFIN